MMPLALIGAFALLGWGLFVWSMYRAGRNTSKLADALSSNAKLIEMIRKERKLFDEQIMQVKTEPIDADSINDTLKRMRDRGIK